MATTSLALAAALDERRFGAFGVNGDDVEVLLTPKSYYESLLSMIQVADDRFVISSLYIGDSSLEEQLVMRIHDRLIKRPSLRVHVILDHHRAQRERASGEVTTPMSRLRLLCDEYGDRCTISLLRPRVCPRREWVRAHVLRGRAKELLGVHHMKFVVCDDSVLLTSANISKTYFTCRQDRYMVLRRSDALATYYDALATAMANGDIITTTTTAAAAAHARRSSDTLVYPSVQYHATGVVDDTRLVHAVLDATSAQQHRVTVASGYANFEHDFERALANVARVRVLAASREAGGWYGTRGLPAIVSGAYDDLLRAFARRRPHIDVQLYSREHWQFHAKGMWIVRGKQHHHVRGGGGDGGGDGGDGDEEDSVYATVIGSSNYGHRSRYLDTENQVCIVTTNPSLQRALTHEVGSLQRYCAATSSTPPPLSSFPRINRAHRVIVAALLPWLRRYL